MYFQLFHLPLKKKYKNKNNAASFEFFEILKFFKFQ